MNIYTVSLNGKATTYTQIENIPFEISEDKLAELHKNSYISFFSKYGEIRIIFSKDNEEIYNEVYTNPKPVNENGSIKILHYNENGKLHSEKDNIPSVIDTLKNKKSYHKNGKTIIEKELLKDDYGEYTLLKNLQKGLNLKEVRCYTDGFRQHIKNNGNIGWILNHKFHSTSKDIPALIGYHNNGSISYESYYMNGERHREEGPAHTEYYQNYSVKIKVYYINNEKHREDGPANIEYYKDGSIFSEAYYINGKLNREEGPAYIEYYEDGSIQYEEYYIDGVEQK